MEFFSRDRSISQFAHRSRKVITEGEKGTEMAPGRGRVGSPWQVSHRATPKMAGSFGYP